MKPHQLIVTSAAALALLAFSDCQAEEGSKQSAASRQSSKARDYATRQDKDGPPDITAASTTSVAGQKDGDKAPVLDSPVVENAAKDAGDNWKKMGKVLDRF
jgi:hypothetical protein